jgi:hypothetical protein
MSLGRFLPGKLEVINLFFELVSTNALLVIHFRKQVGFHSNSVGRHYATSQELFSTTQFLDSVREPNTTFLNQRSTLNLYLHATNRGTKPFTLLVSGIPEKVGSFGRGGRLDGRGRGKIETRFMS